MIERYTRPEMGALWTIESRLRAWLEVELAVCQAWNERGIIDDAAMKEIKEKADFDVNRVLEIEEETRHDVIAFLTAVEEKVGPSARFIHLGCTSSDIVDTANALLLVRAGNMILKAFDGLLLTLKELALKTKSQLCIGRTHGIHAEPTSFGLKILGFYAEFQRHRARFVNAIEGIKVGKISGAVGTYAMLDPELEKRICEILGLGVETVSTQIISRDRYADYFTALALTAGGVERLCVELRHLQRTEVLEVEEGFGKGQKGSSAMPHKKNPISAENMAGLSRLIRTNALASMENMPLWHERDISHSSVERVIMPDSTILTDYVLNRLTKLIANLVIYPKNMERNLWLSHGLFFSQRVLTALIEKGGKSDKQLSRQEAYVMVQKCAMQSWQQGVPFTDLVYADTEIRKYLKQSDLSEIFDLKYYLRHEDTIFKRVLEKA
ncbi:adenylosuccinate lyase [Desulfovibrio litoralis]|uniref:Adenylosuccinate lyase n=1 Tax=Desulfovibrio litoralis DSM 11393 TaxID=1121455 RepID=A0A1M7RRG9_9BACT|nr:adenylosuccinate lyase [Desulfovibrio litoralis]SHN48875.1 Adenylosuccinate lyase [Desulfovibrio litoralis DSM 11393]